MFKDPMQQTTEQMKKKAADDMVEALKKEIMTKKVNYLNIDSHGSCRILCSHWNVNFLQMLNILS